MMPSLLIYKHSFFSILTAFSLSLTRVAHCSTTGRIPHIASYFGTKGRYEEVNTHLRGDILSVDASVLKPPSADCRPIHLTAIVRHGSRYPTVKNIRRMRRLHELVANEAGSGAAAAGEGGGGGGESWLEEIKSGWEWDMWYTDDMDGRLVEKGRDDHRHLATRLAKLLPSLLDEANLRDGRLRFQTSSKHRCVDSTEAFQQGLHKHWGIEEVTYRHEVNDGLMRFFEHCRGYVEGVEKNKTALAEVEKFKGGEEMERVMRRVEQRLGLPRHRLTPDLVEAAFFLCSYEFSIKDLVSPWCQLFDVEDAKVLEYKGDLKQYWKRGHGYDINRKSSCSLFHDLFTRLDLSTQYSRSGQTLPEAVTVQVGHAETLLPLLSLLGLHKDHTQPTATNYHAQHERSFRSGLIVPYAANLLFVLYDCPGGARLQMLLNESPVRFPGLEEAGDAPPYQEVRRRYAELLGGGCDFTKECEVEPPKSCSGDHRKNTEL